MRLFRDALRRLGAASLMLLPTACGVRSGPPAPVVLAVPPAGHYAAAPAAAYAPPPPVAVAPSRPYPAAPPPVAAVPSRPYPAAPPPVAAATERRRPMAVAALPPPHPSAAPPRPVRPPPRALAPAPGDREAMAEVQADVARDAAASEPRRRQGDAAAAGATREPAAKPAAPPAAAKEQARFLWPVRGRLLARFGTGANGAHNDGINIAAPRGAPITAADAGTVAYAGNELRGYGNLILIKHAHGWITAYAHCDVILVKKGQMVARGQVIGRVGATGNVSQAQLHFELRRGDQPVDPLDYLGPAPTASAGAGERSG